VAHADPRGEIPLVLSTLGGEVELQSKRRRRRVKASDFFRSALVTDREPDELVVALYWPKRRPGDSCAFLEFAIRGGDFAIVSVAAILDADRRLRLGFGGCGETPQVLEFREFGPASTQATADKAASRLDYRADVLASSTYRRQLASVLAATAISTALARETSHA
jgi:2-furoyl-CoA dehydrogenase FAD binding subunit